MSSLSNICRPRVLAAILLGLAAASLPAQVTFTFSGTATNSELGYTASQAVTFTFTTTASFNSGSSVFTTGGSPNFAVWFAEDAVDGQLWASITGTGLTGTYASAPSDNRFENIVLEDDKPTSLLVTASSDTGLFPLGTLAAPNAAPVNIIGYGDAAFTDIGVNFTPLPTSYVSPESFFGGYTGTYTGLSYDFAISSIGFTSAVFAIDTVTISAAAIPEPSTYALAAGLLGLGLSLYRRRQMV